MISRMRLHWPFASPNDLAVVLLTVALLVMPLMGNSRRRHVRWASTAVVIVLTLLLLATSSRGGWCAYVIGLVSLVITNRGDRRWTMIAALAFLALILLVPAAARRAQSISDWQDSSIAHRLTVWRAALAMMWDHRGGGVGIGGFGRAFNVWYRPPDMTTGYDTAMNNVLTLGDEAGLLALGVYLAALLTPLVAAWTAARAGHRWAGALAAAIVGGFVAGNFTYSLTKPALLLINLAVCTAAVVLTIRARCLSWRPAMLAIAGSITLCFALLVLGHQLSEHPTWRFRSFPSDRLTVVESGEASARDVIWLNSSNERSSSIRRPAALILAHGARLLWPDAQWLVPDAELVTQVLRRHARPNVIVVAHDDAAATAISVARADHLERTILLLGPTIPVPHQRDRADPIGGSSPSIVVVRSNGPRSDESQRTSAEIAVDDDTLQQAVSAAIE